VSNPDTLPRQTDAVRKKASGSSFYLAMRLMPRAERDAMFAIYAFCRKVDDIADDGVGTRPERHARLEQWRADLDALYAGQPAGQADFLKGPVAVYGLRKEDFFTVIAGMDMDVAEDIVAPGLETLDLYCERVASAVGRLSIKVFGMEEGPGFALSHHLGRALQLTNILRDIDEDAAVGRLYLPREYLEACDCCRSLDPRTVVMQPQIDTVCRKVAALAHHHYAEAARILAARPKGRLSTPRLMGAVYSEILKATEAQGFAPPRKRVSLPRRKLLALVLRQGLG
jgi:presqualene diphosphate synthase